MAGVTAVVLEVLVTIRRFAEEVRPDPALLKVHLGVQERDGVSRRLSSEMDGMMEVVEMVDEGL